VRTLLLAVNTNDLFPDPKLRREGSNAASLYGQRAARNRLRVLS